MVKMKDSGIEWIGEIPEDWEIHPVYSYFEERKQQNNLGKEQNLLSLSYGNVIRKNINTVGGLLPASFNTYNIIEKDDIVIRPTDLQNDKRSLRTGLCKEHGIITSAYITLKPKKNVYTHYYYYLLHAYDIEKVFYNMGNGVRQGLNYSEFSKLLLVSPNVETQKHIADFLDRKCEKIDSLRNDIQKQIEILEQYKKSVITEAVTKGITPDVKMKDSGIEWIGKIPEHWKKTRLEYCCTKMDRTFSPKADALICSNKGEVVLRGENSIGLISDNDNMYQGVKPGDLLIHGMDTWHGAIGVSELEGKCTRVVHVCESLENKFFICYYLQSLAFKNVYKAISNGVRENTSDFRSWEKTGHIPIFLPPKQEQDKLANYINNSIKNIKKIITTKQQQLQTLEDYKKSLIFEYVTGKKEC